MIIKRRRNNEFAALNTASLPDLIFTVLFFFMIVTHMRTTVPQVKYEVPQGSELTQMQKKSAITYIYIGRPRSAEKSGGEAYVVQLDGKIATPEQVGSYVSACRERMAPEDQEQMTVSIRADKDAPMGLITAVKQELRKAGALHVNYSATQKPDEHDAP